MTRFVWIIFVAIIFPAMTLTLLVLDGGIARAESNNGSEIELFSANLSGPNEATPNTTIATGRAVMTVMSDTLYYRLTVADIDGVTMAHIHEGPPGVDGPIVFTLVNGAGLLTPATPISGTITLTPEQKGKLQAGDYYVNVHTNTHPGGQIRGQLGAETLETAYNALLLGQHEVGPVNTPASAVATFTLVPTDTYTLTYELTVSEIVSITAAHIHRAPVGVNGPVVYPLYNGVGPFDPNNPISGTVNLNAMDLLDLLTGYFYVNVHTTNHASGEIRGQMGGARLFAANLAAANEVANVESIATGRAVLALSRDTTELTYRVLVDDIDNISMAHIHRAPFGVNGPIVHNLFTGGGAFDPDNPISGTLTLTTGQVIDLITGNYYVNVHTAQYGSGEIRGQVGAFAPPTHLNAVLTGQSEVPPVDTDAVGIARLTLDSQTNMLHHTVIVADIVNVTLAHIHRGALGINGPPVFTLFNQASGDTFGPNDPIGGGNQLDAGNLVDLFSGYYYVNVHTSANPGGEIRGQVGGAQIYEASLSGAEENPPVKIKATGRAVLALSADTTSLAYRVSVNEINNVTLSHIHLGERGVNGGVIFDLFALPGIFDPAHPISGTIALDTNHLLDLIGGDYYVNVHTSAHPSGEIRGQIDPYTPRVHLHAALTGAEETATRAAHVHTADAHAGDAVDEAAAVDTDAVGIARLTLDSALNMVRYSMAVTDIVDITAAHIHLGPRGVAGPIRFPLYDGSIPFGAGEPVADALTFDAVAWVDLLTGYHYVNVHTSAHPSGEIRGQLGGASLYAAPLSGAQEVPVVGTSARGNALLALSADTTGLSYRVQVADIEEITNAHIHKAPLGEDGDIVFHLLNGPFTPDQPISGTLALSTTHIFDLLQGNYYVNVHTTAHPGGEIRGQIHDDITPTSLFAALTVEAEAQASQAGPSGRATFTLDPELGILYYSVIVANITDITLAHIHKAPIGVDGPVVFDLFVPPPGLFDPDHPLGGLLVLEGPELIDLLTGFYYVNVHTSAAPSGLIRGQIMVPLRVNIPFAGKNPPFVQRE